MIEDALDRLHDVFRPANEGGSFHIYASKVNDEYLEPCIDEDIGDLEEFDSDDVSAFPAVLFMEVRTNFTNKNIATETSDHLIDCMVLEKDADATKLRKKLRRLVRAAQMTIENAARDASTQIADFFVESIDYGIPEGDRIYVSMAVLRVIAREVGVPANA